RLAADPDAAVVEFTAAIQRNFDRAEVYWARAEAYKGLKDKRIQMVQDYKRAAEKVPQQDPNWKTYTERRNKVIEEAIKEGVPYTDDPVELQKIARQATSDDKVRLAALCYDAMLGVQPRIDDPEL